MNPPFYVIGRACSLNSPRFDLLFIIARVCGVLEGMLGVAIKTFQIMGIGFSILIDFPEKVDGIGM